MLGAHRPCGRWEVGVECTIHKLVADVALFSEGRTALVRYRDTEKYDRQRGWFLPDDFLEHGEHPNDAARRILRDQLGLDVTGLRLVHVESFGGEGSAWHLVFHHRAEVAGLPDLAQGANVASAAWFPLDGLPARRDVAHGGWAIDVLEAVRTAASTP
jgi:ADP-ribose pyrophosphatase YjhB (NUDIX family)